MGQSVSRDRECIACGQPFRGNPCVYCGKAATTVDHIRPLARGGHEIEANLTAACKRCNSSKGAKLLTEWRPERVARAIAVSPAVAKEYERQLTEIVSA